MKRVIRHYELHDQCLQVVLKLSSSNAKRKKKINKSGKKLNGRAKPGSKKHTKGGRDDGLNYGLLSKLNLILDLTLDRLSDRGTFGSLI